MMNLFTDEKPKRDALPIVVSINAADGLGIVGSRIDALVASSIGRGLINVHSAIIHQYLSDFSYDDVSKNAVIDGLERTKNLDVKATKIGFCPRIDDLVTCVQTTDAPIVDPHLFYGDRRLVSKKFLEAFPNVIEAGPILVLNTMEASALVNREVDSISEMKDAARRLFDQGAKFVSIAGTSFDKVVRDIAFDGSGFEEIGGDKSTLVTAGKGEILSAAMTCFLTDELELFDAYHQAQQIVFTAIEYATELSNTEFHTFARLP